MHNAYKSGDKGKFFFHLGMLGVEGFGLRHAAKAGARTVASAEKALESGGTAGNAAQKTGKGAGNSFMNGAERAAQYGKSWSNSSLKEAIKKFSPNVKGTKMSNGKTIYYNPETGIQVVYDRSGKYFRIENTTLTGKNRYLDMNGTVPNNKVVNGKISGRSKEEYKQITHFNNTDN